MATSDRDEHEDREEKDDAAEDERAEDKDDADDGDDEADEERAAAEKKAAEKKEAEKKAAPKSEPGKAAKRPPGPARGARGPGASRVKVAPAPKGGSLGKSMLLFVIIVGGLAAGFAILGREEPQGSVRPKWNPGQVVDVEITVVKNDKQDLSCSSTEEIAGKHCGYEANGKPWSKGDNNDEKKVFRPYTTTERLQFAAAGLWSEPALAPDKLPATRFSVKCKYKVEGTFRNIGVRWESTGQWFPNNDWYAGSVSDCKIVP